MEERLYRDEDCEQPAWYEHPRYGRLCDFVLIPLTPDERVKYCLVGTEPDKPEFSSPPAKLSPESDTFGLEPAQAVSVVGYPFGLFQGSGHPLWATGFIASEPVFREPFGHLCIDCRARPGQSGSPVYAKSFGGYRTADGSDVIVDGNVWSFVGVYSGRINESSDLGIVFDARIVHETCNEIRLGEFASTPTADPIGDAIASV